MLSAVIALSLVAQPGAVLAVGGGETTPLMVTTFLDLIGGKDKPIVVLAQTRETPSEGGVGSVELLKKHGASDVTLVGGSTFTLAEKREVAKLIFQSRGVWIPGGDQNRVPARFGTQWVQHTFAEAIKRGISFFGTSAGCALFSNPMMAGTNPDGSPIIAEGSGIVPILFDTHFKQRNRQARLRTALSQVPTQQALGLSEGEWVVWRAGKIEKIFGSPELWQK